MRKLPSRDWSQEQDYGEDLRSLPLERREAKLARLLAARETAYPSMSTSGMRRAGVRGSPQDGPLGHRVKTAGRAASIRALPGLGQDQKPSQSGDAALVGGGLGTAEMTKARRKAPSAKSS
jgi:hypothetical protein